MTNKKAYTTHNPEGVETGLLVENDPVEGNSDNDRIIFYASPKQTYTDKLNRSKNFIVQGGTASSFEKAIKRLLPNTYIYNYVIEEGETSINLMAYFQKEKVAEFLPHLGITRKEWTTAKEAINNAGLNSHQAFFKLDFLASKTAGRQTYYEYALKVAGLDNANNFQLINTNIKLYSEDRQHYTSSDFGERFDIVTDTVFRTNCYEFQNEELDSFFSQQEGRHSTVQNTSPYYDPLKRYRQALWYKNPSPYGLDCNPSCVMYFLQSYGLIPPYINRKKFEYAFTPLNPTWGLESYDEEEDDKNTKKVCIKGNIYKNTQYTYTTKYQKYIASPREKLFDNCLLYNDGTGNYADSKKYLRGFSKQYDGGMFLVDFFGDQLKAICDSFYNSIIDTKPESIKKYKLGHIKYGYYNMDYHGIANKYQDLVNGVDDDYFERHPIFVGLLKNKPIPGTNIFQAWIGHFCLIVANKKNSIGGNSTIYYDGNEFRQYLADDPFYGRRTIIVPTPSASAPVGDPRLEEYYNHFGADIFIYPNAAIGSKHK